MSNRIKGFIEYKDLKGNIVNEIKIESSLSKGTPGKSAYEVWLLQGNTGTEENFFKSIINDQNIDGGDSYTIFSISDILIDGGGA